MNTKEVELINQWILYNKYFELAEKAEKEWYEWKYMIYKNRADISFYKYKEVLLELNRDDLEMKFLETIHEDIPENILHQLLSSDKFDSFVMDYIMETIQTTHVVDWKVMLFDKMETKVEEDWTHTVSMKFDSL